MRKQLVKKQFERVCKKYGITDRRLTKEDFYRICEGEKIHLANNEDVREMLAGLKFHGAYCTFRHGGKQVRLIYLRCFFQKYFNRQVAFHELGHHFMKHLSGQYRGVVRNEAFESEADYFSELATGLKRRAAK